MRRKRSWRLSVDGAKRLGVALVEDAVKALHSKNEKRRALARAWLKEPDGLFDLICRALDMDVESARAELRVTP